jgi:MFS superfamily sulfate permease-like transporter
MNGATPTRLDADPDPEPGPTDGSGAVPVPTLLAGMLTAVAAGAFVGWALLPLSTTVAGLPLYAVAAVVTTLCSGLSFLRRELPTGVLAEGFYLMGAAMLTRPVAVALSLDGLPGFQARPGALLASVVVAVVAGVLLAVGWRLDTHARRTRVRRMRRQVGRRMSRRRSAPGMGADGASEERGAPGRSDTVGPDGAASPQGVRAERDR